MSTEPNNVPNPCVVELRQLLQSMLVEDFIRLYHYGSRVEGGAEAESDYDVLCVTKRRLTYDEVDSIIDRQLDIQMDHSVLFDLHFYSEGEINSPPISFTPYIQHVRDEGIIV